MSFANHLALPGSFIATLGCGLMMEPAQPLARSLTP